jgi:hypothetical protein
MGGMTRLMPAVVGTALLLGCGESMATAPGNNPGGGGDPNPPPAVLLQDVVLSNLPSPYFHFEYDAAGRVQFASFASGFTMYDVIYDGSRITELKNNTLGNQDRLEYLYDGAGRVSMVSYVKPDDSVSTRLLLSYDGEKLTRTERQRSLAAGFTTDRIVSLSYYPDGNLLELTEHRPFIAGRQEETTTVDHFEQYDDGINVDGFGLLHSEFSEHLVLLPGVQLQKGNPARVTHTGDGVNYSVDFTYVYDDRDRPLTKNGDLLMLNGPDAGRRFQTQSLFTYY